MSLFGLKEALLDSKALTWMQVVFPRDHLYPSLASGGNYQLKKKALLTKIKL